MTGLDSHIPKCKGSLLKAVSHGSFGLLGVWIVCGPDLTERVVMSRVPPGRVHTDLPFRPPAEAQLHASLYDSLRAVSGVAFPQY